MPATSQQLAQDGFDVRLEWGMEGLERLAPVVDVVVVIDVLSFTSAVSVAVARDATVFPYRLDGESPEAYAAARGATLARRRSDPDAVVSLSPAALDTLPTGSTIVLPSPNGSALSFAASDHGTETVIAGSLRNASAVGRYIDGLYGGKATVGVIPAGERWQGSHGAMRAALEDLLGAGAIVAAIDADRSRSPEAMAAAAVFADAAPTLRYRIEACPSGRELVDQGFEDDVAMAADVDATTVVPVLGADGAYRPG